MNGGLASLVLTRMSCIPTGSGGFVKAAQLSFPGRLGVRLIRVSLVRLSGHSRAGPDSGAVILTSDPFGPGRMPWRISAARSNFEGRWLGQG